MSLFIEVRVGSKDNNIVVARSHAYNISGLADVSDYEFESVEFGNEKMNIPRKEIDGRLYNHSRNQSVWDLVEKIAKGSK